MENEISDFNRTPLANRLHIGFFGRRNAGKSSLVNAITGQPTSIVSPTKGTTTDPVKKTMELLPLAPSSSSIRRAQTIQAGQAVCAFSGLST